MELRLLNRLPHETVRGLRDQSQSHGLDRNKPLTLQGEDREGLWFSRDRLMVAETLKCFASHSRVLRPMSQLSVGSRWLDVSKAPVWDMGKDIAGLGN